MITEKKNHRFDIIWRTKAKQDLAGPENESVFGLRLQKCIVAEPDTSCLMQKESYLFSLALKRTGQIKLKSWPPTDDILSFCFFA